MRRATSPRTGLAICAAFLWLLGANLPLGAQETAANGVSPVALEISGKLVETASLIQSQEQQALDSEARLGELSLRRHGLSANFDRRRGELSELLGVLQRVGRQPPALLITRPETAVEQVRGVMLLGAVIRAVEQEAANLRAELIETEKLEAAIAKERRQISQLLADLNTEKDHLSGLLLKRHMLVTELEGDAAQASAAVAKLAARSRNANELLTQLLQHRSVEAPRAKPQPEQDQPAPGQAVMAAVTPPRLPPHAAFAARGFDQARGNLMLPARGKIIASFGRANGAGGTRRGITIRTRESAEVIAPFAGKVVFAGEFRDYGQLLILEVGNGYHILLSGMSRLSGVVGQAVALGEPVGRMGGRPEDGAGAKDGSDIQNLRDLPKDLHQQLPLELYVEFRKDGQPFNPLPWLAVSEKKVSG